MMLDYSQIGFLLITYFISAIPFGLLLTKKFLNEDIRNLGSKNIGATNVTRIAGKKLGLVTLILDALKGAVMVRAAIFAFPEAHNFDLFIALVAFVAVFAHIFPIYIRFKGGKGVATTLAVVLAIDPLIGLICLVTWLLVFLISRVSALSSIAGAIVLIPANYFLAFSQVYVVLAVALSALIIFRHKSNIMRLINKEENKF